MQGKRRKKRKIARRAKKLKRILLCGIKIALLWFISIKAGIIAGELVMETKARVFEASHPILYMTEADVIESNFRVIEGMNDGWQRIIYGRHDRLEAAKTIAQIEALNLHLSYVPDVETGNLEPTAGAHFNPKERKIVIRADRLLNCSVEELITTVCHEMKHAEQYELIKAFRNTDKRYQSLAIYDESKVLEEEFKYYIHPDISKKGYRNQYCEREARKYAEERLGYYIDNILCRTR